MNCILVFDFSICLAYTYLSIQLDIVLIRKLAIHRLVIQMKLYSHII